jgi:hypothetical protein
MAVLGSASDCAQRGCQVRCGVRCSLRPLRQVPLSAPFADRQLARGLYCGRSPNENSPARRRSRIVRAASKDPQTRRTYTGSKSSHGPVVGRIRTGHGRHLSGNEARPLQRPVAEEVRRQGGGRLLAEGARLPSADTSRIAQPTRGAPVLSPVVILDVEWRITAAWTLCRLRGPTCRIDRVTDHLFEG